MGVRDPQICGLFLLGCLVSFASYYFAWIIIIPFVDNKRFFLTEFFPPIEMALNIATVLIGSVFILTFSLAGVLLIKHSLDLRARERLLLDKKKQS